MRDIRIYIYIYIIDLEAEFYFQSGVSTRIASCSAECLHILKYLASHRPAGTSKYIHTAVLVSICGELGMHGGQNERENAQEDWTSHIFHHLLVSLSSSHSSSCPTPSFTFMRWRGPRIVRGFFHRVKRALYASNKPPPLPGILVFR